MFVQGYRSRLRGTDRDVKETAQRAAVATLVVGGILVAGLAVWELRLVVALLFLAFILAAAMRPTVDRMGEWGIPRAAGIGLHYVVFIGLIGVFLWLVVPRAIDQVDSALGARSGLSEEARQSTGVKHEVLTGIQRRLEDLPSGERLVDPAVELTLTVVEIALGIFFTLACAAYWIFERDRA
jgi:predicted PurR-regulated permease PerM